MTTDRFAPLRGGLFIVLALAMLWPGFSAPTALALGAAFALILGNPWPDRTRAVAPLLLKICVVGLGFGLPLGAVIEGGLRGVGVTGLGVAAILMTGLVLARLVRVDPDCGRLISTGTAVCGGSAIAAVAPVLGARDGAVSMSLACVFVLNALALYLFPLVGHALDLSQSQFALWAAIAIHDTSSVVGAASSYGDQALAEATVLKLARALWIVPLVVLFMFTSRAPGRAGRITWPLFVAVFVLAAALRGTLPTLEPGFDQIATLARRGLVLTLFLIGAGLTPALLRGLGWKPMAYAATLWVLVSSVTLFIVML